MEQVTADEEKVAIVLKNLVENAVKFNDKDKKIVRIAKYELNNMTGILVEDNGKGISQEQKGKLFDKFVQIEESFTGQVEGLGLGLALCKLIIEAHSGKIGFESVLDKGSKFYFVIPKPTFFER
ncbi:MAG: ATP-binding protein [Elusimicrobiota bacterium]|nr:ATP-binding protein [Elusimicrobiota bacterium]